VFIKIGQYQLKSQVLLAPMAGTSDKPFRMLCKFGKLGIGKNMFNIIKNQFQNTLGSFRYQNVQSKFFLYEQR
jgi:tRNA-dihydrouridine synthase B